MKRMLTKVLSACLGTMMMLSCIPSAFAAPVADATINTDASCSLTMYKYDWTNAHKDGIWNEDSFISTGWKESYVETTLGTAVREGDSDGAMGNSLGNGENSNGYAIKGVEYSYLKVADIVTFTESINDKHPNYNMTQVLYGFDKNDAEPLLSAIGLGNGSGRYENADSAFNLDDSKWYYTSDTLNKAIDSALKSNSTVLKDALETFMGTNGGTAMPETDENGRTYVGNLTVGLYLIVETKVPEMVTSTTNPFFVSLPMTTVSGNQHSESPEGGHFWNYDVTLYPKNETGIPTLEKTVRESNADTGKNNATDVIEDGFAHTATGSMGDVMEYQVVTTLPSITSSATSLTTWSYYDTIVKGLKYNDNLKDVKIEFFTDGYCTNKVATWDQDSGKFTVEYTPDGRHMTVSVTPDGLSEINLGEGNNNGDLYRGYSNYTARLTYSATIVSDNNVVIGQNGNENEVVLTWKRTSSNYFDTLVDDAHVYTFGIDLTKVFSDVSSEDATNQGIFEHVKFKIWNDTDKYWVKAQLNEDEGIYYSTDHVADEADATVFTPVTLGGNGATDYGHIMVKGLEDDEYVLTEIETADGFTLLKDQIRVKIDFLVDDTRPCNVYEKDILGVLQNDPHYTFNKGTEDLSLANIPQKQLSHNHLTARAFVDDNPVTMLTDRGSENAEAPLTVTNTRGFNPPMTGDTSAQTLMFAGSVLFVSACAFIFILFKKRKHDEV